MAEPGAMPDARTQLAEALFNDPETRPLIEQGIVKKWGDKGKAAIPGYGLREAMEQDRAALAAEREQWRAERERDKAERELERSRRSVYDDPTLRIQPHEIEHVEKMMVERSIGEHRAAAELYRANQQRVAEPRGISFAADVPGLNGAGGDEFKGIIADADGWARNRAAEIINDFRAGRGAKWE